MWKKIYLGMLFSTMAILSFGQAEEEPARKFFIGGNLGLQFGTVTFIEASPLFGYQLNPKLTVGAGIVFQYLRYSKVVIGEELKTYVIGSKFFGRYLVYQNFFITSEAQLLSVENYDPYFNKKRANVPVFFVGGGYQQQLGERSFATISVMFDLIDDPNSPYTNPYIGLGFVIRP